MNEPGLLLLIGVMTAATFSTRIIPFLLLHNHSDHPLLQEVARYAPPTIMTILVIYSIKGYDFTSAQGIPVLIAIATTALLHLWRGNTLLSIFAGTALYMMTQA